MHLVGTGSKLSGATCDRQSDIPCTYFYARALEKLVGEAVHFKRDAS